MAHSNEFREYLASSGGEQAMWDVLIKLDSMKKKPDDPVDFIRQNIAPEMTEIYKTLKVEIKQSEDELATFAANYPKIYAKYLKRKSKLAAKARIKKKK